MTVDLLVDVLDESHYRRPRRLSTIFFVPRAPLCPKPFVTRGYGTVKSLSVVALAASNHPEYAWSMPSKNDARLAILNHITAWFMEFTDTFELDEPDVDALIEEAGEQAALLMESMSLEVQEVHNDEVTVSLQLLDIVPFLEEKLNEAFVEDAEL